MENILKNGIKLIMTKNKKIDKILDEKFLNMTKFSMEVEQIVKKSNGFLNYIEAIVIYCEDNDIDLETVPKLLSKPLKEKLKADAHKLNYIHKSSTAKLPI